MNSASIECNCTTPGELILFAVTGESISKFSPRRIISEVYINNIGIAAVRVEVDHPKLGRRVPV